MGYRSDVKIVMGEGAFAMFKNEVGESSNETIRDFVKPSSHCSYKKIEINKIPTISILFSDVKWYGGYPEIDAVEDFLGKLDKLADDFVEEEKTREEIDSIKENYFYKKIEIGEDNTTQESENEFAYDTEISYEFYVYCNFSV